VLNAADGYMAWMCAVLTLPDPGIRSASIVTGISARFSQFLGALGGPRLNSEDFTDLSTRLAITRSPPHLARDFDDPLKLRPLRVFRQQVAFLGAREAALRTEAELIELEISCGLLDPPLDLVLRFQSAALGRNQAEHNVLAFGHEAQRLEAAGAVGVVFHEVAVDTDLVEEYFGYGLVATLRPRSVRPLSRRPTRLPG